MNIKETTVIVRGGGDLATGTIATLHQCGFKVLVLEVKEPLAIRRTVAFSEAIYQGEVQIEGIRCCCVNSLWEVKQCFKNNELPIVVDPYGNYIQQLKPDIVVDAIIAKKNLGTTKDMAKLVIGIGPGFVAPIDVHVAIETKRGHQLGRIITNGTAIENTGVPGNIGGYSKERVIHANATGIINHISQIGDIVRKGEIIAMIDQVPVLATIDGVLRGLIKDGLSIKEGLKIADIDPRIDEKDNCYTISDKARTIAGSVLQAIIMYGGNNL